MPYAYTYQNKSIFTQNILKHYYASLHDQGTYNIYMYNYNETIHKQRIAWLLSCQYSFDPEISSTSFVFCIFSFDILRNQMGVVVC